MSSQGKSLYYNGDLCIGCHSCEVACKVEHNLPAGVNRVQILAEGPTIINGELRLDFKRVACMRCPEPSCIEVCPTGAIKKRQNGVVLVNRSLCTGCQDCIEVCLYNAIKFHPQNGWAEICDLCADRLSEGLAPFCVQHCMSGALFFGTEEEFKRRKKKIALERRGK